MIIAISILALCIFFMMLGIFTSKTLSEKIMSVACMTNYVIVLLCMFSLFPGRDSFVDIAYIYGLFGFVMNLGLSKLKIGE